MSRRGNPYDNARCERFMRTLKQEEVYLKQYRDLEEARQQIGRFLEEIYNGERLHSALAYQTPDEFEAAQRLRPPQDQPGHSGAVDPAGAEAIARAIRSAPWKSRRDFHRAHRPTAASPLSEQQTTNPDRLPSPIYWNAACLN